jgi:hypothetical protein
MTPTRPELRRHIHPGTRIFDINHHRVYRIQDLHDEDRTALITGRGTRFRVNYGDLLRNFRIVQPY